MGYKLKSLINYNNDSDDPFSKLFCKINEYTYQIERACYDCKRGVHRDVCGDIISATHNARNEIRKAEILNRPFIEDLYEDLKRIRINCKNGKCWEVKNLLGKCERIIRFYI